MKKSTIVFLSTTMLLLGIVIGFLTAPIKHGINIGNRSGNQSGNHGMPIPKPFSKASHCCSDDWEEQDAE